MEIKMAFAAKLKLKRLKTVKQNKQTKKNNSSEKI